MRAGFATSARCAGVGEIAIARMTSRAAYGGTDAVLKNDRPRPRPAFGKLTYDPKLDTRKPTSAQVAAKRILPVVALGAVVSLGGMAVLRSKDTAGPASSSAINGLSQAAPAVSSGVGKIVSATKTYELRTKPSDGADRFINEKATKILGSTHYQSIDTSTTVRILGRQNGWSRVQVVSPEWLTSMWGWAPDHVLAEFDTHPNGNRIWRVSDMSWDKNESGPKDQIVARINKIVRDTADCASFDGLVTMSPTRSTPGNPVYFIPCGRGAATYNIWFSLRD